MRPNKVETAVQCPYVVRKCSPDIVVKVWFVWKWYFQQTIYLQIIFIHMCKKDFALNKLQELIFHLILPNQTK